MKTESEWANILTERWQIGNSITFCDETPDWDCAESEELQEIIKQIQLDAFRSGMEKAADYATNNSCKGYCGCIPCKIRKHILDAKDKINL